MFHLSPQRLHHTPPFWSRNTPTDPPPWKIPNTHKVTVEPSPPHPPPPTHPLPPCGAAAISLFIWTNRLMDGLSRGTGRSGDSGPGRSGLLSQRLARSGYLDIRLEKSDLEIPTSRLSFSFSTFRRAAGSGSLSKIPGLKSGIFLMTRNPSWPHPSSHGRHSNRTLLMYVRPCPCTT